LSPSPPPIAESTYKAAVFAVIDEAKLQAQAYVYVGTSRVLGIDSGKWKTLSMQFTEGVITDVDMKLGDGAITVQQLGGFFQAAELGGNGLTFANGHVATVTFEAGTDMSAVRLDYESINTYVVQPEDPSCVPAVGSACDTAPAVYFSGTPPPAVVAFSGEAMSTSLGMYVFAQAEYIKQVSVGFTHSDVDEWSVSNTLADMQIIQADEALGMYRLDGGFVPTGVSLATVGVSNDACVGACIDPDHVNSNVETIDTVGVLYDVMYVFGSELSLYNPCETCGYVVGFGDAAECAADGDTCTAADGALCDTENPGE